MPRASVILFCIVIGIALGVGVTVVLAVKKTIGEVSHRLDCAVAQSAGQKAVDSKGQECLPADKTETAWN